MGGRGCGSGAERRGGSKATAGSGSCRCARRGSGRPRRMFAAPLASVLPYGVGVAVLPAGIAVEGSVAGRTGDSGS